MSVIELEDDRIPNGDKIVIKFSAQWCKPCQIISPLFKKLAKEHTSIHFYEVDVDENQTLSEMMNITAMPTFVFLKEKKEVIRMKGADEKRLVDIIKNF